MIIKCVVAIDCHILDHSHLLHQSHLFLLSPLGPGMVERCHGTKAARSLQTQKEREKEEREREREKEEIICTAVTLQFNNNFPLSH